MLYSAVVDSPAIKVKLQTNILTTAKSLRSCQLQNLPNQKLSKKKVKQ